MAKIQFNATTLKTFRNTIGKYYIARHQLNDYIEKHNVIVAGLKASLSNDEEQFWRLTNGDADGITRDADAISASIADLKNKIDVQSANLASAKARAEKAEEKAIGLITPELYNAYVSCCNDGDADAFADAIAAWFKALGAEDATAENCRQFVGVVGKRDTSVKQAHKTGKLTDAKKIGAFTKTFLGNLSDILVDNGLVDAYKYTFVPTTTK